MGEEVGVLGVDLVVDEEEPMLSRCTAPEARAVGIFVSCGECFVGFQVVLVDLITEFAGELEEVAWLGLTKSAVRAWLRVDFAMRTEYGRHAAC